MIVKALCAHSQPTERIRGRSILRSPASDSEQRGLFNIAANAAANSNAKELAALVDLGQADQEAELGFTQVARSKAEQALALDGANAAAPRITAAKDDSFRRRRRGIASRNSPARLSPLPTANGDCNALLAAVVLTTRTEVPDCPVVSATWLGVREMLIPVDPPLTAKLTLPVNVAFASAVNVIVPVCPRFRLRLEALALTVTEGTGGGAIPTSETEAAELTWKLLSVLFSFRKLNECTPTKRIDPWLACSQSYTGNAGNNMGLPMNTCVEPHGRSCITTSGDSLRDAVQ